MIRRALPPEPLSDVVKARLEALLAEVPPRRLLLPEAEAPHDPQRPVPEPETAALDPTRRLLRRTWEFTRHHLVAVAIVVLTGCLWTGYSVLHVRSTPVAVAVTASSAPASPTAASAAPTAGQDTPAAGVVVHVLGAVRHPGLYRLPGGARVADALKAAGGLRPDAAPAELNLAALLPDGAQVLIGRRGHPRGEVRTGTGDSSGTASPGGGAVLDLNSATAAQLDTLPGVGPVTAQKILAWRAAHGRFTRLQELQEVDGIGPKSYQEIAPHVHV